MLRKSILTLAFVLLLVTPALPASASATGPDLLHWLPGWLQGALSWFASEHGPSLDPGGLDGSDHEEGPKIDPSGLYFVGADAGPKIDPSGTEGQATDDEEQGPSLDPLG